jgi:hypothetical protein
MYHDPLDDLQAALDGIADDIASRDPRAARLVETARLRLTQYPAHVPVLQRVARYASDLAAAEELTR